jgi:hypothetical protein
MRKSVTGILAGGIAVTALLATAAAAVAKGPRCVPGRDCPDPVELQVTVDGPDLAAPIVIRSRDAWSMLNVTGVNYRPYRIMDEPPAHLGPRYEAVYRFTRGDDTWLVLQDVYPYADGRPFAFTQAGQRYLGRYFERVEASDGWRGSRTLEWILEAHGLPEKAPAASEPGVRAAGTTGGGATPPWWLGGILALGALVLMPRLRRRST